MTAIDANSLLAMRSAILERNSALQRASAAGPELASPDTKDAKGVAGFGDVMKGALEQVNDLQSKSSAISEAYERGDTTDIAAVMLARQTASIGFEATLQVRNKLLTAYKDIMSMPV
ncbi:flagellar hook-basal body complex protein FliE [Sphingoaurantiacus capsulatus]|uniref:Flagellar hook-basal body complex protein FliE n=1 Tax=Sphingoaurantiacus capsulatus TaxID=1771310 RepID=A0ABV7XGB0_9SPHN